MSEASSRPLRIFVAHASGLLTDSRPNGDGLVACGFLKHLAKRGHQLEVAVERSHIVEKLPDNIVLHHIGDPDAPTPRLTFMRRLRALYGRLERNAPFDLIHQLNPVYSGLSLALIGTKTPIILGTYIGEWPSAGLARGPLQRVRAGASRWLKNRLVATQQSKASALLLTTPAARSRVLDQAAESKIFMLDNGVEIAPVQSRDANSLRVLSLCGLAERKGAFVLIEAFKMVAERLPEARLTIGGAVEGNEVLSVFRALGPIAKHVEFIGGVSRAELTSFLASGTVFCMPSIGEPYGMAALEAMAAGLPIVASNGGGLAFLVSDEGGIKVSERAPSELADALLTLLIDPERRVRLGSHNRKLVCERYAWDRVIERLEGIYETVISREI